MTTRYTIRKLSGDDYYKGYLQLLERLTVVESNQISHQMFCNRVDELELNIYIYVIVDNECQDYAKSIVATGTLLVEKKFIHKLGSVGHIEDIVVHVDYGGKGLGKMIVNYLTTLAQSLGCYKTILDCNRDNIGFYNKCGFVEKEVQLVKYY